MGFGKLRGLGVDSFRGLGVAQWVEVSRDVDCWAKTLVGGMSGTRASGSTELPGAAAAATAATGALLARCARCTITQLTTAEQNLHTSVCHCRAHRAG